jgi:hypothetical protein
MRRVILLVAVLGCSSSHGSMPTDAPGGGRDGQGGDAPGADAAIDAPLMGNACATQMTEVARITNALSAYPYNEEQILVGDFDHNGSQDIAVVEGESDSTNMQLLLRVRLFLRTATGFASPVTSNMIFPYYGPEQIIAGDFNGDHRLDILLSYTDSGSSSRVSYVYPALQQSDHTFLLGSGIDVSACSFSSDERLFGLAVNDVNSDGYDDVLATVSYNGLGAPPAGLSLLRGTASGLGLATCARSASSVNAGYPLDLVTAERFAVGDFDGDGMRDLAGLYPDHIALFHHDAASMFSEASGTTSYDEYAHIAVDHVAGRAADRGLVATTSMDTTMNSTVKLYAMTSTGVAAGLPIATLNEDGGGFDILRGYAVGDFNGDGLTDVIEVGNHNYSNDSTSPVSFGMACDRGSQWQTSAGTFPGGIYYLRGIDFDAGHTDVVVNQGNSYDLVVYSFQ